MIGAEVERAEDELEGASLRADEQRGGIGARRKLPRALIDQHPEADRQIDDQRNATDQHGCFQPVIGKVLPGEIKHVTQRHHLPLERK